MLGRGGGAGRGGARQGPVRRRDCGARACAEGIRAACPAFRGPALWVREPGGHRLWVPGEQEARSNPGRPGASGPPRRRSSVRGFNQGSCEPGAAFGNVDPPLTWEDARLRPGQGGAAGGGSPASGEFAVPASTASSRSSVQLRSPANTNVSEWQFGKKRETVRTLGLPKESLTVLRSLAHLGGGAGGRRRLPASKQTRSIRRGGTLCTRGEVPEAMDV